MSDSLVSSIGSTTSPYIVVTRGDGMAGSSINVQPDDDSFNESYILDQVQKILKDVGSNSRGRVVIKADDKPSSSLIPKEETVVFASEASPLSVRAFGQYWTLSFDRDASCVFLEHKKWSLTGYGETWDEIESQLIKNAASIADAYPVDHGYSVSDDLAEMITFCRRISAGYDRA